MGIRKGQPRAWKLAGLGILIVALAVGGWEAGAMAARSRGHARKTAKNTTQIRKTTNSKKSTHTKKPQYVTRNPLASLKASVERKAQQGRAFDRSTDDGSVRAFVYGNRVQKIVLHLLGERGQVRNTYYLQGRWVFCVVKERWVYNRPASSISTRPLKMAKVKHEEYYLATGLGLHRASPRSKLTKMSSSQRKAAELQLTHECAEASRILKIRGKSTSGKKARPAKSQSYSKSKKGGTNRSGKK